MTKKNLGYPFQYGDELTPEMAGNNRKQAVSYSVLILNIWWHNLGFGEPIQSYSSCLNESKTPIVQSIVKTSRVNSINRGGDLGKSGPGPAFCGKSRRIKKRKKNWRWEYICRGFYSPATIWLHVRSIINPYLVEIMSKLTKNNLMEISLI